MLKLEAGLLCVTLCPLPLSVLLLTTEDTEHAENCSENYFTFKKMMTSVYSASDSMSARPRIRAN
jgi:hypothetical protein